jgi:hypothetical protein
LEGQSILDGPGSASDESDSSGTPSPAGRALDDPSILDAEHEAAVPPGSPESGETDGFGQTSEPENTALCFRYGKLHDLESVWWIALWFLTRTVPKDEEATAAQEKLAAALFSRSATPLDRFVTLTDEAKFQVLIQSLPSKYRSMVEALNILRRAYYSIAVNTYSQLVALPPGGFTREIAKVTPGPLLTSKTNDWSIYQWFDGCLKIEGGLKIDYVSSNALSSKRHCDRDEVTGNDPKRRKSDRRLLR